MTMCDYANNGYPEVIKYIYSLLSDKNNLKKNELIDKLQSYTSENNPKIIKNCIKTSIENINLLDDNDDGYIFLSKETKNIIDMYKNKKFSFVLRRLIFKKQSPDFLKNDNGVNDFIRPCTWALCQNIYELPSSFTDKTIMPITKQQTKIDIFRTESRVAPFLSYAQFLGFISGGSNNGFFIDPTNAIAEDLNLIFHNTKSLSIKNFIQNLSTILPVLDYGEYRKDLLNEFNQDANISDLNNKISLSTSLSFALKRLEAMDLIQLNNAADAEFKYNLNMNDNTEEQLSQITMVKK